MRSIRLSLVVYFLVLLAVALGAVSILVHRTAERNLRDRQKEMGDLLRAKHQAHLDETLLQEARNIAALVQIQGERGQQLHIRLTGPLGMLTAGLGPDAVGAVPLWALRWGEWRLQASLDWITRSTLKIKDMVIPVEEGQLTEFVQINSGQGAEWHSPSLEGRSLPFNPKAFSARLVDWKFDNTDLEGTAVRRVTLKVTQFPIEFRPPGGPAPAKGPRPRPPSGLRITWGPKAQPTIYVQCAYDPARTNGVLGQLQKKLDEELAGLEESTQEALYVLGRNLLVVNLTAFAAVLLGVLCLVHLGMSPLSRLTEAVSKVSAKDFRLPLEDRPLPTELRPIVERLKETLGLLKRAFAREKQAATDISHELRTPLAALMTTLDVALRKPRSAERYREILEECQASGQHMYSLVERLLVLARLDAGVDNLRPREVDVAALADQCASLVRPLAEARGLSLRVHNEGPAAMKADPDKLREVVTNLLHNAIEYNRPEGSIDLAVTRDNGDLRVEVRDTGIGIAPEQRSHIFERFYRSDPSRAAEGLHAGLGLAIVKGYVDLMGGSIDVESTPGEGSTFRVRLPAEAPANGG
ncbi:MAG: ATP-binding protein [Gemmataceae bacterium]|nr:ATP-binding protein [Gemmataceae bacterium]